MIYLSGVTGPALRAIAQTSPVGIIVQPGNSNHLQIGRFRWWAADNGCFAASFVEERWLDWLETLPTEGCLFATAPDVLGDPAATWLRSEPWLDRIREFGMPAALVAQDGLTAPDWDRFDVLFLGGTTFCRICPWRGSLKNPKLRRCPKCAGRVLEWKLGQEATDLAREARRRGKWVHMGRVNSFKRLQAALVMGCQSVDGTLLRGSPDRYTVDLANWLVALHRSPFLSFA